jgi:hypothetical protein
VGGIYRIVEGVGDRGTGGCENGAAIPRLSVVFQGEDVKVAAEIRDCVRTSVEVGRISAFEEGLDEYGLAEFAISGIRGLHADEGV